MTTGSSTAIVACAQTRPQETLEAAISEAQRLVREAADRGAALAMLPEYAGGLASDGPRLVPPVAPDHAHPFVEAMQDAAKTLQVEILIGSVAVTGPGEKFINRGYMIDAQGAIQGRYDKIHMFDIQLSETEVYRESASVAAGDRAVIHDTALGRLGHTICYDLRFPHLYRMLAQAGAEILCAPAGFTAKTGAAHWHVLTRARAIENTSYMVSPCAVGPVPGGGACYGHSLIVSPWGEILAEGAADAACVITAEIDLARVAEARAKIPSLTHDRDLRPPELPLARSA